MNKHTSRWDIVASLTPGTCMYVLAGSALLLEAPPFIVMVPAVAGGVLWALVTRELTSVPKDEHRRVVLSPPCDPDNFTREEARDAVKSLRSKEEANNGE